MDSILESIKKMLGLDPDYCAFDQELVMHINSVFLTLNQLGVGPEKGFLIKDNTENWSDFIGENDDRLEAVKSYIYLKVRLLFDPPNNSFVIESMTGMINEYEWRLNVAVETELEEE